MWKGYVVLKDGGIVSITKETLPEMLDYIAQNYHCRATDIFAREMNADEKQSP